MTSVVYQAFRTDFFSVYIPMGFFNHSLRCLRTHPSRELCSSHRPCLHSSGGRELWSSLTNAGKWHIFVAFETWYIPKGTAYKDDKPSVSTSGVFSASTSVC